MAYAGKLTLELVCHVVDNYGDIAVVWRLAQALVEDLATGLYGDWQVRVLVDDLVAFLALNPSGHTGSVTVLDSRDASALRSVPLPDVILEAFGAPTPVERLEAFFVSAEGDSGGAGGLLPRVLVHLEYLTAESWSERYHLLPSPLGRPGVERVFFVPGFREQTGGLVFTDRQFDLGPQSLPPELRRGDEELLVTVFSYEHDFTHLWEALATRLAAPTGTKSAPTARVMVFEGRQREGALASWERVKARLGTDLAPTLGRLTIQLVPFVSQDAYTALVNQADFNVVRGEESWVTAVLSGKPFLWHAYLQDDNHQLVKVNAFLEVLEPRFAGEGALGSEAFSRLAHEFREFNDRLTNSSSGPALEHYSVFFEHQELLTRVHSAWAHELRKSHKLSRRLLDFLNGFQL